MDDRSQKPPGPGDRVRVLRLCAGDYAAERQREVRGSRPETRAFERGPLGRFRLGFASFLARSGHPGVFVVESAEIEEGADENWRGDDDFDCGALPVGDRG
jgi:hypothetical protein